MSSPESLPNGAQVGSASGASTRLSSRTRVAAGFGSPAEDATVHRIDLNEALIDHPDATFIARADGDAMRGAGIDSGDVLLVDRARTPMHGNLVLAVVHGEIICRRLYSLNGQTRLDAASIGASSVQITEEAPLEVWGVVTHIIKHTV